MNWVNKELLYACRVAYFTFLVLPEKYRETNRTETNLLRHAIAIATEQKEEDVDEHFEILAQHWLERSPF